MPLPNYENVYCIGCHSHCKLDSQPTIRMLNCVENHYGIWPSSNHYFKEGIKSILVNMYYNFSHAGFIFVDFSKNNIRLFTSSGWIELLGKTQLKIILICDNRMKPLAAYWKEKCHRIVVIIYTSDTYVVVESKIRQSLMGRRDRSVTRNKLTDLELIVLDLFIRDHAMQQVASILMINIKKVYSIKRSLQIKMGGRGKLNSIISG